MEHPIEDFTWDAINAAPIPEAIIIYDGSVHVDENDVPDPQPPGLPWLLIWDEEDYRGG